MPDSVQFLLFTGILVFFYHSIHVIIDGGTRHDSRLLSSIHGKLVDIIGRQGILYESPVCNPALKHLLCLIVDAVIIHVHVVRELGFRPVNI